MQNSDGESATDKTTELVLFAILRGLFNSGAVGSVHLAAVLAATADSAEAARGRSEPDAANALEEFASSLRPKPPLFNRI